MTGQMIDWDLAVATASRLAGQGPTVSRTEADQVVGELRAGAARSTPLVREFTGLTAEAGTAPVLVVDREGWIQANADAFAQIIGPVVDKLQDRRGAPGPLTEAIGSRVTGLEVGALLGFLGGKVLGQFDPFHTAAPSEDAPVLGRLLLVAPNIVHAERELGADPSDFRLWVCLHEETHRVQFTAVPWMRDHLQAQVDSLVNGVEVDPQRVAAMLFDGLRRAGDLVSGRGDASLIDLFATPAQREVIPSVEEIRKRFNQRRKGTGSLDRLARRLLGLDAKMAQYRNGAHFVRTVIGEVGMEGFNKVWVEPDHLPSKDEIGDPAAWIRRVHG